MDGLVSIDCRFLKPPIPYNNYKNFTDGSFAALQFGLHWSSTRLLAWQRCRRGAASEELWSQAGAVSIMVMAASAHIIKVLG